MFGLGLPEILLIFVVALIFIGPKKLPEIAQSLGKAMGEFKKAANDLKDSINQPDEPVNHSSSHVDDKPIHLNSAEHSDFHSPPTEAVHETHHAGYGEKKSDE